MAFARAFFAPNLDELFVFVSEDIVVFRVFRAEEFVETRLVVCVKVDNKLVHGSAF